MLTHIIEDSHFFLKKYFAPDFLGQMNISLVTDIGDESFMHVNHLELNFKRIIYLLASSLLLILVKT